MHPKKQAKCVAKNKSSSSESVSESNRWMKLPDELLELISGLLDRISYLRFRAVCRSWLSVLINRHILSANELSWRMLENCGTYSFRRIMDHDQVHHLNLPELVGKSCLGYSEGWLIMVNSGVKCSYIHFRDLKFGFPGFPGARSFSRLLYPLILQLLIL
ncbi:hypothetical protein AAC387_Pa09g1914 [Persea americana]